MEFCIVFFETRLAYLMYRYLVDERGVEIPLYNGMVITEKMMVDVWQSGE